MALSCAARSTTTTSLAPVLAGATVATSCPARRSAATRSAWGHASAGNLMRRPLTSCRFGTAEQDVLVAQIVRGEPQRRQNLFLGQERMRAQHVLDRQPF